MRSLGIVAGVLIPIALVSSCRQGEPLARSSTAPPGAVADCAVASVVDGDTLRCEDGTKVRLLGVDAPEVGRDGEADQCWARESAEALRQLVDGKTVRLTPDPGQEEVDVYGRTLAYVHDGGEFMNAALIRDGHARARASRPPLEKAATLEDAEGTARGEERGLWRTCES